MTRCLRLPFLAAGLLLAIPAFAATAPRASAPLNQDGSVRTPGELLADQIKATPYEGRAELRAKLVEAEARFSDRLGEWENKKNSLPEEERNAAEVDFKQLVRDREILRQKIDGVESAGKETWESAKSDLHTVLVNTILTYRKLSARFKS